MSWKQSGGVRNQNSFHNLTIGTLVADKVILRESYAGAYDVQGSMNVTENIQTVLNNYIIQSSYTRNDVGIGGNTYINQKVYFGRGDNFFKYLNVGGLTGERLVRWQIDASFGDGKPTLENSTYLKGDCSGIGINTPIPESIFDVRGLLPTQSNVLNVRSVAPTNRNIIAQNNSNHGIVVYTSDSGSNIEFYNNGTTAETNSPDVKLATIGGNVVLTTTDNMRLEGNVITLLTGTTQSIVTTPTTLTMNAKNSKVLTENMVVSNNNDRNARVFRETMTLYDTSNGIYLPEVYENPAYNSGDALTLVADNNNSNTFMNIVTPDRKGLLLGGGKYPLDNTRGMATMGVFDTTYKQNYTIVSGTSKTRNKTTMGINTYAPRTEKYVLDINGSTHISNGEIHKMTDLNFEVLQIGYAKNDSLNMIAVGTPTGIYSTTTLKPYTQNIAYTNDGGIKWTTSRVTIQGDLESSPRNFKIYMYDANIGIIGSSSNFYYYTNDGGRNWRIFYIASEYQLIRDIKSIYIEKYGDNIYRVILLYREYNISTQLLLAYFDFDFYASTSIDYSITIDNRGNHDAIETDINIEDAVNPAIDGTGDTFYIVAKGIRKYSFYYSSNGIKNIIPPNNVINPNETYYTVTALNTGYVVAGGRNIISYTKDGTNWTDVSLTDMTIRHIYLYNDTYGVAVGDNGLFLYTKDGYVSWNPIPYSIINAFGNAQSITGTTNMLRGVFMSSLDSMVVHCVKTSYSSNTTGGLTKVYNCYLPNLFNRENNNLVDVSGNMVLSGDVKINDGGKLKSNNDTFYLLDEVVSNIHIGSSGSTTNVGNKLDVSGNVLLRSNMTINKDVRILGNLYVNSYTSKQTVTSIEYQLIVAQDMSLNGRLFLTGDASFDSLLVVGGDASLNSNLFVAGDSSLNGYLVVGGKATINDDVSLNSNVTVSQNVEILEDLNVLENVSIYNELYVRNDTTFDSRLFLYGDASLNSNLLLTGDASLNSNLFVAGDSSFNGYLAVDGKVSITDDVSLNSNVTVGKNVEIIGNMEVLGTVYIQNDVIVEYDASLNSNFFLMGDASLNSNLFVAGDSSLNGDLIVDGKVSITDDVSLNSNVTIGQNVDIMNELTVVGNTRLEDELYVIGKSVIDGKLTVNNDIFIEGMTEMNNIVFIYNKLSVKDDISLNRNLIVAGDSLINGNLSVNGKTELRNDVSLNSNVTIGENVEIMKFLTVSGEAQVWGSTMLEDTLYVRGNTDISGCLNVEQDTYIIGDTSITGNLLVENGIIVTGITLGTGSGNDETNSVFGYGAFPVNTDGYDNVAIGANTMASNSSGSWNTAVGSHVLIDNTIGDYNIGIGYNAGNGLISGNNNTFLGKNTGVGIISDVVNTNISNSTAVGANVLLYKSNQIIIGTVNEEVTIPGNVFIDGILETPTPQSNEDSNVVATTSYVKELLDGYEHSVFVNDVGMNGDVDISGTLDISNGGLIVRRNATVYGNLDVINGVTLNGPMSTNSNVTINSNLIVTGDLRAVTQSINDKTTKVATTEHVKDCLGGYLNNYFSSDITIEGNTNIKRNIILDGLIYVNSSLLPSTENSKKVATTEFVQNVLTNKLANDITMGKDLTVSGNINVSKDIIISGNANVTGVIFSTTTGNGDISNRVATTLFVNNMFTNYGFQPISSGSTSTTNLSLYLAKTELANLLYDVVVDGGYVFTTNGNANLNGKTTMAGNVTISNDSSHFNVNCDVSFQKDIDIIGQAKFQDYTSFVSGIVTDKLWVDNDAIFDIGFTASGDCTFKTDIWVDGSATFSSNVYIQELGVIGNAIFGQGFISEHDGNFEKDIWVDGSATFSSNVHISELEVYNNALFDNILTVNGDGIFNANITIYGNTNARGNVNITNDLNTTGNVTLNKELSVAGNITTSKNVSANTLIIATDASFHTGITTQNLTTQSFVTFQSGFTANNNARIDNKLSIGGNIDLSGSIIVDLNANIKGGLTVNGLVTCNNNCVLNGVVKQFED